MHNQARRLSALLASASIAASVIACSVPALAGEDILYRPAPAWIAPVDLTAATDESPTNLIILDRQLRIADGLLWEYADSAVRIGTPQELTQAGTIGATWLPDKGDLIVHEVSIQRGDQTIDVLGQGGKLEILRREQSLEQRVLNGELTATLAVPGLQVGDVLRSRYSVTSSDQALGHEVESISLLFREPDVRPGFARVRASWEEDAAVRFQAGPDVTLPPVDTHDGYDWLELDLPLAKAQDMPMDAPGRFLRPPLLQIGTFADWADVAAAMAPYYATDGSIQPGGPLAAKAAGIARDHETQLPRAVAALELVQEEIGYLANGLEGGNYLPQSPQQTWDLRYGDCKAKTKLLLALLSALDIKAEAVLVSSGMGDALQELMPMPGVFDHVLVRAEIDGASYWLDGTSAGANEAVSGNVPPFRFGLPLRASGSTLEPIEQTLARVPEATVSIEMDQRAGIDIPVLVTSRFALLGPSAALLNANRGQLTQDQLIELGYSMIYPILGVQQVTDVVFEPGEDDSELVATVTSLMTSPTEFDGVRGEQTLPLPINRFAFDPDRARRQWRAIPVDTGAPFAFALTLDVILPDDGAGFALEGPAQVDETLAGQQLHRSATLDGARLKVAETITGQGGELSGDALSAERKRAAALAGNTLKLRVPAAAGRRWRYAGTASRAPLEAVEGAYAALIAREPDEEEHYANRASFRMLTDDFAGALADYTQAIEHNASAELFAARAQAHAELLDRAASREDLEESYRLAPDPAHALMLADAMADTGDIGQARALLEEQDGDETIRYVLADALAELDGRDGDPATGLARLDALLADKANDAQLLNAKCWYMGKWNIEVADALPLCTRAVENTTDAASVLDSRAMVYLRNGRLDAALADADAALALEPGQTQTVLLRGLILRAKGDPRGPAAIREAAARSPALIPVYRRYGFDLAS